MDSKATFQNNYSKNLENLFFLKQDQKLIKKLHKMRKLKETKEELSKVSGITNDSVLQKLVGLNVRPETLASLTIIPLIEVAWSDDTIAEGEKKAVLDAIAAMGFKEGSTDFELAMQWMTHKPEPELLEAWTLYIRGLCEQLDPEEKKALKNDLLGHAVSIANACGGFLGLGNKISKAEQDVLDKLESAFGN